ncbi:hypothetical protein PEG85_11855 [Lactococcus cremoris]|uniref:DUF7339 family protein n=1 Tax=Lactococcus lactis subsp. cremoris TaxID=1359 RepID=UPI0022E48CD1|nr:hypothetical protein [Lactococcus cremoris]MDA2881611.1 hypothetical protein [Lactococcus cremoris]MDA2884136.1 hypothetical protein [Lactococcus cremoris]
MKSLEFWDLIDKYLKENNMSLTQLNNELCFRPGYLKVRKDRHKIPSAIKMVKLKNILSDDVLYELITTFCVLPTSLHDIREVDDFILSLEISKEMREKQRMRRKLQRTTN